MSDKEIVKLRKLAEKFTGCLRDLYQIEVPIRDIRQAVKSMGGHLIYDASLSELQECKIAKIDEELFVIHVSPFLTEKDKTFKVAKALGWVFIRMGFSLNPAVWDAFPSGFAGSIPMEFNAVGEEFASAFLMPEPEFMRALKEHTVGAIINTGEIAAHFNVTKTAAANRGDNLGVIRNW